MVTEAVHFFLKMTAIPQWVSSAVGVHGTYGGDVYLNVAVRVDEDVAGLREMEM